MLALLKSNAQFRRFWSGQTASMFGNYTLPVALALFAALHFHTANAIGLVLGARAFGSVAMLLLGGALADSWDRRKLMIASDIARLVLVASLATSPRSLIVTMAICGALGAAEGLFYPAYNVFVVELVEPESRQVANSLSLIGMRSAAVAAPAFAAIIVAVSGTSLLFEVDALTFLVSLYTLLRVRRASRADPAATVGLRSVFSSISVGLNEVRRRRWIGIMIGQDAINSGFAYAPVGVLLPLLLLDRGYRPATFATIAACSALGSVLGGYLGSKVHTARPGLWALGLTAPFGLYAFAIALSAAPPVLMALAMITSAGQEVGLVLWYTSLQREVPEAILSRVNSVDWMGSTSLQPVGQALTGSVAGLVGATPLLLGSGVVFLASTLIPLFSRDVRAFKDAGEVAT